MASDTHSVVVIPKGEGDMLIYVSTCLARLKGLLDEYEIARQMVSQARIEQKSCQVELDEREAERSALLSVCEAAIKSNSTAFEDKEVLSNAIVTLKKMRSVSYDK